MRPPLVFYFLKFGISVWMLQVQPSKDVTFSTGTQPDLLRWAPLSVKAAKHLCHCTTSLSYQSSLWSNSPTWTPDPFHMVYQLSNSSKTRSLSHITMQLPDSSTSADLFHWLYTNSSLQHQISFTDYQLPNSSKPNLFHSLPTQVLSNTTSPSCQSDHALSSCLAKQRCLGVLFPVCRTQKTLHNLNPVGLGRHQEPKRCTADLSAPPKISSIRGMCRLFCLSLFSATPHHTVGLMEL